jgi:hypothetical protein
MTFAYCSTRLLDLWSRLSLVLTRLHTGAHFSTSSAGEFAVVNKSSSRMAVMQDHAAGFILHNKEIRKTDRPERSRSYVVYVLPILGGIREKLD